MYTYFQIMNDFGFKINTILFINQELGYEPNPTDLYNPYQPNMGNTNYGKDDMRGMMSWNLSKNAAIDSRLYFVL
jgi:hypothetical protein